MTAGTDVAVIGAGIVGLATAHAVAERGAAVTVYERGVPGNAQSGGESRIFRHVHRDPRLVRLARDARAAWREWEQGFGVELLRADGTLAIGPSAPERLALLREVGGIAAREVDAAELTERLPVLARWTGPALLDEDAGVLRARAAVAALVAALGDSLVADEVIAVRPTARGTVEVRAGGSTVEHGAVVVCAGRGTAPLAAGVGLALPVAQRAHVRLTFPVRGEAPPRLACLQDDTGAFGEPRAYGDPLPGNGHYAAGLDETEARDDGSLLDPSALAAAAERTAAYAARALPGLVPEPVDVRHCWVTALPWSPDAVAAWQLDGLTFLAGHNLFKHAPVLGRALARVALGEELHADLRPEAQLGLPGGGAA